VSHRLRAGLADLATAAKPVDLRDRVHRGARRITHRNRIVGAMAGLLLVAGGAAGYAAWWPSFGSGPAPGTSVSPTGPQPSATPVEVDLFNATFTVPAYPGPWAGPCPGGERTFVDGWADAQPGSTLELGEEVLRGDLDGAPGDEFVLRVRCFTEGGSDFNLLAVKVGPDGAVTALGWVNVDADGGLLILDPAEPVELRDGTVRVGVIWRYDADAHRDKQTRAYAARDGRMVQVDGPTTFAPAPTDPAAADLRNMTLYVSVDWETDAATTSYGGYVKLVDGKATAHFEKIENHAVVDHVVTTVTVTDTALVSTEAGPIPVGVFEVAPADGPSRWVVIAYHPGNGYAVQQAWKVFIGDPGERIESITAAPERISVRTANGTRTFQYNTDVAGPRWFEI
jgi:hypothetical protein